MSGSNKENAVIIAGLRKQVEHNAELRRRLDAEIPPFGKVMGVMKYRFSPRYHTFYAKGNRESPSRDSPKNMLPHGAPPIRGKLSSLRTVYNMLKKYTMDGSYTPDAKKIAEALKQGRMGQSSLVYDNDMTLAGRCEVIARRAAEWSLRGAFDRVGVLVADDGFLTTYRRHCTNNSKLKPLRPPNDAPKVVREKYETNLVVWKENRVCGRSAQCNMKTHCREVYFAAKSCREFLDLRHDFARIQRSKDDHIIVREEKAMDDVAEWIDLVFRPLSSFFERGGRDKNIGKNSYGEVYLDKFAKKPSFERFLYELRERALTGTDRVSYEKYVSSRDALLGST